MKVYIAGPMTGFEHYNYGAFMLAAGARGSRIAAWAGDATA